MVGEDEEPFGPLPPSKAHAISQKDYGTSGIALMPGECHAIAQYVQAGMRIPRRGEIGLTSQEIEDYESAGYAMSGSRHRKMTAIRIRKESQVFTAEEKRALALLDMEAKAEREKKVMRDFQDYIDTKRPAHGRQSCRDDRTMEGLESSPILGAVTVEKSSVEHHNFDQPATVSASIRRLKTDSMRHD
eukprot:g16384.t1